MPVPQEHFCENIGCACANPGPTGPQGIQGPAGPPGPAGASLSSYIQTLVIDEDVTLTSTPEQNGEKRYSINPTSVNDHLLAYSVEILSGTTLQFPTGSGFYNVGGTPNADNPTNQFYVTSWEWIISISSNVYPDPTTVSGHIHAVIKSLYLPVV